VTTAQASTKPHVSAAPPPPKPNRPLSADQQKSLVGGIIDTLSVSPDDPNQPEPAPFGYFVALDESGSPTGSVTPDRPDGPHVSVMLVTPVPADVVTTPTGAPITSIMNPSHIQHDPAMLERNPSSEKPPAPKQAPTPAHAPTAPKK
jgi:hypothetical protein